MKVLKTFSLENYIISVIYFFYRIFQTLRLEYFFFFGKRVFLIIFVTLHTITLYIPINI